MKYRCLILDHDDTVVQSTPEIHYPSFVEALRILRPEAKPLTIEEFVSYCFQPGFTQLCTEILRLTKEEQEQQYQIWKAYTGKTVPNFYPGMTELLSSFQAAGGLITVVSHSESTEIIRDYHQHCGFTPQLIFGWELVEEQRKPNPYPIQEILRQLKLEAHEVLVVDDLRPGLIMARRSKVDFAAAGWSHTIPAIREYMQAQADYYFPTVASFSEFIFSGEQERG